MNRILLAALVLVIAASLAITAVVQGHTVDKSFFLQVPATVTVVSVVLFLFDRWAWRPIGRGLGRPVVVGTWRGKLISSYVDPRTQQPKGEIDVVGVVTQTFSTVVFRLYSAESSSISTAAALVPSLDGRVSMTGVYMNTPRPGVRDRSDRHLGGFVFDVQKQALNGEYWADRKTYGEISLAFASRDQAESFEEGLVMTPSKKSALGKPAVRPAPPRDPA